VFSLLFFSAVDSSFFFISDNVFPFFCRSCQLVPPALGQLIRHLLPGPPADSKRTVSHDRHTLVSPVFFFPPKRFHFPYPRPLGPCSNFLFLRLLRGFITPHIVLLTTGISLCLLIVVGVFIYCFTVFGIAYDCLLVVTPSFSSSCPRSPNLLTAPFLLGFNVPYLPSSGWRSCLLFRLRAWTA